jgi:hypothetical protein
MYDGLWDENLVTLIKTPRGTAYSIPLDSDVNSKAQILSEGAHDGGPQDLFMGQLAMG